MTEFSRWADSGHHERAEELAGGRDAFEAGAAQLIGEARARRLVELRKERGFTQTDMAARLGIDKGRTSQIESGQVSGSGQ
ncbi:MULTISPECIES: helix-turn-helix domain-containing protein [unclassified Streptomyces]|uniref:helix-turn-helix domain-containing protein n=1 Tax=unclassified Streptomyces TaxID=2593676 RepID=UPI002E2923A0|nr:helix-turn-helix transcriptional regulator [Streptomyces sp. NBC_00223]